MANIRLLLTAGSVLMLALLLACSPSATPPGEKGATPVEKTAPGEQAAPTEKAPKRGGILSVSNSGNSWHTQDPALGLVPGSIWMRAGSRIIDRNIETYELEPAAIESWEFSPDGKEITMRVRKGMKFHNKPPVNGREVEARDIVYSMKSNAGLQYPGYPKVRFLPGSDYDAMVDAVAVDKYTVKVTLNRRSYSFLHAITNGRHNHVLPDGLREEFGGLESLLDTNKLPQRAIGSGPFVVKKVDNLIEAVFERHPDYWEKGKPYLDGIRGIWLPDRSTELAAFVAGQIDYTGISAESERDFILKSKKDTAVKMAETSCWHRLTFNTTRKPFDDVRVRKAIALVIDHKSIGQNIFGSWEGKPLWRYPGPVHYAHLEALPQEELAKHPLYQGPTPENVAEARRLLKEAGYEKGFEVEMMYQPGSNFPDSSAIIEAQVAKNLPGVKFKLARLDGAIQFKKAVEGDFDVQNYCHSHYAHATGVINMHQAYHSQGSRNYGRYKDPAMDELLDKADLEFDLNKRRELMRQAQYRVFETVQVWPVMQFVTLNAEQPYFKGRQQGGGMDANYGIQNWWFDK